MPVRAVVAALPETARRFGREGLPPESPSAYVFAAACAGIAALAHTAFAQFSSDVMPSILYNPAVFIAALFAGMRAGLTAAGLSVVMLWGALDARNFGGRFTALAPVLNCALYLFAAGVIIWIAERYRSLGASNPQASDVATSAAPVAHAPYVPQTLRDWWHGRLGPNSLTGYVMALVCIAIATLIRWGFGGLGGEMLPLVSYYPGVLLAALMGGAGAGLLAMVSSLAVVWAEFPAPLLSLGPVTREESVGLSLYVFVSLLTVWLAEHHRHAAGRGQARESAILALVASVLVASAAVLLATFVLLAVDSYLAADHLVLGYLLPTVIIAMHYGSTLAVVTSFVCGLAAAYFLFPPKLSFYIADPLHIAELGFFLLLAVIASKAVTVLTDDPRPRHSHPCNRAQARPSDSTP